MLMKLEVHQAGVRNLVARDRDRRTGIACPQCMGELEWVDDVLLLSNPPQRRVKCVAPGCSFQRAIFV